MERQCRPGSLLGYDQKEIPPVHQICCEAHCAFKVATPIRAAPFYLAMHYALETKSAKAQVLSAGGFSSARASAPKVAAEAAPRISTDARRPLVIVSPSAPFQQSMVATGHGDNDALVQAP